MGFCKKTLQTIITGFWQRPYTYSCFKKIGHYSMPLQEPGYNFIHLWLCSAERRKLFTPRMAWEWVVG